MTVVKTADSERIRGNEERDRNFRLIIQPGIQHRAKSQDQRVYCIFVCESLLYFILRCRLAKGAYIVQTW